MEVLQSDIIFLSADEFLSTFRVIVDIGIIKDNSKKDDFLIKVSGKDFDEFMVFVNVYAQMLSIDKVTTNHRDIFSVGIASLKLKQVKKIRKILESKLENTFNSLNKEDKKLYLIKIIKYLDGVELKDLGEYCGLESLTKIIKNVKNNRNHKRLMISLGNELNNIGGE